MAQYRTGTVSVTNGSNIVTGEGTSWLSNVEPGDLFTVVGHNFWYEVASVDSDTQLTLSANWPGEDQTGLGYAIATSFTPHFSIPYPEQGDIQTASLVKRAVMRIEQVVRTTAPGAISIPLSTPEGGTGAQSFGKGVIVVGSGGAAALRGISLPKGTILIGMGEGNDPVILPPGPDGSVLIADSTSEHGVRWGEIIPPTEPDPIPEGWVAWVEGGEQIIDEADGEPLYWEFASPSPSFELWVEGGEQIIDEADDEPLAWH